jgi:hypothetical protein
MPLVDIMRGLPRVQRHVGLADAEIREFERTLPGPLPPDVAQLLRFSGGFEFAGGEPIDFTGHHTPFVSPSVFRIRYPSPGPSRAPIGSPRLDPADSPALRPTQAQVRVLTASYENPLERALYFKHRVPFAHLLDRFQALAAALAVKR